MDAAGFFTIARRFGWDLQPDFSLGTDNVDQSLRVDSMNLFIDCSCGMPRVVFVAMLSASVMSGCSLAGGLGEALAVQDSCRNWSERAWLSTRQADCRLQRRQAYEQALGQLSLQVLR